MAHLSEEANNHNAGEGLIPSVCWGDKTNIDRVFVEQMLLEIKNKIAPCKPKIIGVTKYYGLNAIVEGYKAGLRDFGESRAADAIQKIESLPEDIRRNSAFHFIGHLQTNKAEKVVKYFDYIHSIDSFKIAKAVSESAKTCGKRVKILLQVNVAEEEQKFGYTVNGLKEDFVHLIGLDSVDVVGLMCMARFGAERSELYDTFCNLRKLRDFLENEHKVSLPELSMGMSDDYEVAVQAGSTIIRIGRKLFK